MMNKKIDDIKHEIIGTIGNITNKMVDLNFCDYVKKHNDDIIEKVHYIIQYRNGEGFISGSKINSLLNHVFEINKLNFPNESDRYEFLKLYHEQLKSIESKLNDGNVDTKTYNNFILLLNDPISIIDVSGFFGERLLKHDQEMIASKLIMLPKEVQGEEHLQQSINEWTEKAKKRYNFDKDALNKTNDEAYVNAFNETSKEIIKSVNDKISNRSVFTKEPLIENNILTISLVKMEDKLGLIKPKGFFEISFKNTNKWFKNILYKIIGINKPILIEFSKVDFYNFKNKISSFNFKQKYTLKDEIRLKSNVELLPKLKDKLKK